MRFTTLRHSLLIGFVAGSACFGPARGAALYGVVASGDPLAGKWESGVTLVYSDGVIGSIAASWSVSDPAAARAWVSSLPDDSVRNSFIGAYLSPTIPGDPDVRDEALRQVIDRWLSRTEDGETTREIVEGSRHRGSGGGRTGEIDTSGWQTICSCSDTISLDDVVVAVVPEPSSLWLGLLGSFGLLRRRRCLAA